MARQRRGARKIAPTPLLTSSYASARRDQPSQRRRGRARGHVSRQTQRLDRSFEIAAESRQTRGVVVFAMTMIFGAMVVTRAFGNLSVDAFLLARASKPRSRSPRRRGRTLGTAREISARRSREARARARGSPRTRTTFAIVLHTRRVMTVKKHERFARIDSPAANKRATRSTADWDDDARARDARDDDGDVRYPRARHAARRGR